MSYRRRRLLQFFAVSVVLLGASVWLSGLASAQSHPVFLEPNAEPDSEEVAQASGLDCTWHAAPFEGETGVGDPGGTFDPNCAVGPDYLVAAGNSFLDWHLKDGTSKCKVDLVTFFDPITPSYSFSPFDTRVLYDLQAGRFIVVAISHREPNPPSFPGLSEISIAVSTTADPDSGWYFQSINSEMQLNGIDTHPDFPEVSVDGTAIYITATMFDGSKQVPGFRLWIVPKTGLYQGGTSLVDVYDPDAEASTNMLGAVSAPAMMYGTPPSGVGTFLVRYSGYHTPTQEYLSVIRVDDPLGSPTFTNFDLPVGAIDNLSIGDPYFHAPQQGTSSTIDARDRVALSAVWRDGYLYATAEVAPPPAPTPGRRPPTGGRFPPQTWTR